LRLVIREVLVPDPGPRETGEYTIVHYYAM